MRITPRAIVLIVIAFGLLLVYLHTKNLIEVYQAVTIYVATLTAITGWFITVRVKAKLDIELKGAEEYISALGKYVAQLRDFYYGTALYANVAPPRTPSSQYWQNTAFEYYRKLYDKHLQLVDANTRVAEAYEANSIALIKLVDFHDYLNFKHQEFIKLFDKAGQDYATDVSSITTKKDFIKYMNGFNSRTAKPLADQLMDCIDLKKEVLNTFQSRLFGYKLVQRKPLDSSLILSQRATPEVVEGMRKQRDEELLKYSKTKA